ncbi:MAG: sensor histidine kinase [Clostridium sp.]|uniref:sensor histidine kinase n=1 Tax=Clostridium sp. TaxID=1506 RepID=UPI003F30A3E8
MKLILNYLKDNLKVIVLSIIFSIIYVIVFYLYNLPLEPILYGMILFLVVCIIYASLDILKYKKKHHTLSMIKKTGISSIDNLPATNSLIEEDYKDLINMIFQEKAKAIDKGERDKRDILDYYTLWAHQIKTPIAAMNILLQSEESENNLVLMNELFKIEQYVEMVLSYLRMESISSDLVLKNYSLDSIVKQAVRKYAKLFIGKNIKLDFKALNTTVLTDEKWLVFVVEQIISNAIKYTCEGGTISIYMDKTKSKTLIIKDSGIGIKAEDLPRVFEKGFTGFNGRDDKKSTGIGLYLCKSILKKLSHQIQIESEVSKYTRIKIDLETMNLTTV